MLVDSGGLDYGRGLPSIGREEGSLAPSWRLVASKVVSGCHLRVPNCIQSRVGDMMKCSISLS